MTTTFPVVARLGTMTVIVVSFQLLIAVPATPLKVTVPVLPKLSPEMTMVVPAVPEVRDSLVMLGVIVKGTTFDAVTCIVFGFAPLATHTTIMHGPGGSVPSVVGIVIAMLVSLQLVTVMEGPQNSSELLPWVAPKPLPTMVTAVPTGPELGFRLAITGGGVPTVTFNPLDGLD